MDVPRGYTRTSEARTVLVARDDVHDDLMAALRRAGTLHRAAREDPVSRAFHGREVAYAITLPNAGLPVVVRHNRHGGALRAVTGDLFSWPTRAPSELALSLALLERQVPTPAVVGYALYPAGFGFARSDVITEEIRDSDDFGGVLLATSPDSEPRQQAWGAVERLLEQLAAGGARHHDLNVKNILLRRTGDAGYVAYALDVDRVALDRAGRDADAANRARLRRSVEKWRDTRGARLTAAEIEALRRTAPSIP